MSAKEMPAKDRQCRTICLVDDEDSVRGAFRFLLRTHGFTVADYPSPAALLAAGEAGDYACFVLDLHMPGMSGLELAEALRSRDVKAPIIIITGRESAGIRARAESMGVSAFMTKPVDGDVFVNAVENAIAPAAQVHT